MGINLPRAQTQRQDASIHPVQKGQLEKAGLGVRAQLLSDDRWQLSAVMHQLRGLTWAGRYTHTDLKTHIPAGNTRMPHFQNYSMYFSAHWDFLLNQHIVFLLD